MKVLQLTGGSELSEQFDIHGTINKLKPSPGHAMKVADYTKTQGAIIGKALSSVDEGHRLVLVLVTLQ